MKLAVVAGLLLVCVSAVASADWTLEAASGAVSASHLLRQSSFSSVLQQGAFTFTYPSGSNSAGTDNYGFFFDTTTPIVITKLGFWDGPPAGCGKRAGGIAPGGDDLVTVHEVGIWDSNQALLATCTVQIGAPTITDANTNVFRTCDLAAAVTIPVGTNFACGTLYPPFMGCSDMLVQVFLNTITPISGFTVTSGAFASGVTLTYPATVISGSITMGPMLFPGEPSPSNSVSPSPSPSAAVVAVSPSPTPSPMITGTIQVRVPTEQTANVTASELSQAIGGAQGTITVISSSFSRSATGARSVVNPRANACLSNPFTETVRLLFSNAADAEKLAALVKSGDPAVSTSNLCIVSASSAVASATQPSTAATTYIKSDNSVAIGVGVGIGVGIPLLLSVLLVAWCCCPCGAGTGLRRRWSEPAQPQKPAAASFAGPESAVDSYTGSSYYDTSSASGYSGTGASEYSA